MSNQTQCERILAYLRKHKTATNMELVQKLWIASPWTRVGEMTGWGSGLVDGSYGGKTRRDRFGIEYMGERITRTFIKTKAGKRVVQYRLERVK
jgi:hypothetical protein